MSAKCERLNIFEYSSYRAYLRDWVALRKQNKQAFSFRYFSRAAGFRSPNFMKLVMDGERNLSNESIQKFVQALKLGRDEAAFFRSLVQFEQAESPDDKRQFAEQLMRSKNFRKAHPLTPAQFDYCSQWYFAPIRELVDTAGFREDPEWIAQALEPAISSAEARRALEILQQLNLIRRNEHGRLVQTDSIVTTGDDVASMALAQFHREMIRKGSEAIQRFPGSEREISAMVLGLSEQSAQQVKEAIRRFRKEILEIAREERNANRIYQFNFQFFPTSKKIRSGSEP